MPQVGDRRFPYTPAGRAAAKEYADRENTPSRNSYDAITRTIQNRRPPHERQEMRQGTRPPQSQDRRNTESRLMMDHVMSRMSPADRSNPEMVRAAMRDLSRRRRPTEDRWGYPGETRREHFDRDWDRDWDEDTSGRRWHPQSPEAGRR
jgi:hypothetical protein